jgi:2'-5' RNA ligase
MRYALVSYFDTTTTERIVGIEDRIFEMTGARIAREKWDPHITVGAGVELSEEELKAFAEKMKVVLSSIEPFQVELKDYGFRPRRLSTSSPPPLRPKLIFLLLLLTPPALVT